MERTDIPSGSQVASIPGDLNILPKSFSKTSTMAAMNITGKTTEVDSQNIFSRNYKLLGNKLGTLSQKENVKK